MNKQPIIPIKPTTLHLLVEWLTLAFLGATWLLTLYALRILPTTIPIHFNAQGMANNYGSKNSLIALPMIASCIVLLLRFLNKHPHWFNYPVQITQANAVQLYTTATTWLRFINMAISIVFLLIVAFTMYASVNKHNSLPSWLLPLVLTLILLPTLIAVVKMRTSK